ncbi:M20 family metallopeptidase [Saxibacter everestensis]|uniref:M20 family metallopeptidase n=1 Tax=Saxibacter everestensis TaxID=2909229 RepID=A0ABY8QV48_9MICO|nr:M20 family metallopeptidase [Brevibacteriaceae bacterium ZFBP1038]
MVFSSADAKKLLPELVSLRRRLHAQPEIGLQLPRTQETVLRALDGLGLEIHTGDATTSVTAVLRGKGEHQPGDTVPTVLLRGDMDGLPIIEQTELPYASVNGAMHACGHDLHTAGLVGAARLLSEARNRLPGDVIFMFQPGEEGYNGAGLMIDEGVLEAAGNPVLAAYGVHVAADLPYGKVHSKPGPLMAAFSVLDVTVRGRGGHGSRPYTALDPVQTAAEMIVALQSYISRRFDIFDPVVLTVGDFHGGSAANVIPDIARFRAGIRSFSDEVTARLAVELPNLVSHIALGHGLVADVNFSTDLPATINDHDEAIRYLGVAGEMFGEHRVELMENPRAGSEDFSRILHRVPGAYGHLGAAPRDLAPEDWVSNHSPRARFDDGVLGEHATFLAELAARRLADA